MVRSCVAAKRLFGRWPQGGLILRKSAAPMREPGTDCSYAQTVQPDEPVTAAFGEVRWYPLTLNRKTIGSALNYRSPTRRGE